MCSLQCPLLIHPAAYSSIWVGLQLLTQLQALNCGPEKFRIPELLSPLPLQGEGAEDEDDFEDEDGEAYVALDGSGPAGGYAARRARQAERAAKRAKRAAESGDGLGEDDEFESGSEGSGSDEGE